MMSNKQKISEGICINRENYTQKVIISSGYSEQLIEFEEVLLSGLIIENIGIHAASIAVRGYIYIKNHSLSVSLSALIAHPDVHKNIDYSPCYVILKFPNGNLVKQKFYIEGSYMTDPNYRFIGEAKFNLPKNLKKEILNITIIVQGFYNSGSGFIPSIPRRIERELLCQ